LGIAAAERENAFKVIDVHLHMPAGAVKKDGPSAGVAMTVAIVSLSKSGRQPPRGVLGRGNMLIFGLPLTVRGVAPRKGVAMTGEVTLRGAVTPVGGIREKVRRPVSYFRKRKD
jgi:ATP-dependent Lon protease